MTHIVAKVAQIISERELAINKGSLAGVKYGMLFQIISPEPAEIRDPDDDDKVLGTVQILKVEVRVEEVQENLAVCRTFKKITIPGRARYGIMSSYGALSDSIFGDPGSRETERYQTLRSDEPFVSKELDPGGSFVKRGDLAIQISE